MDSSLKSTSRPTHPTLTLLALAVSAFGIGSTEFISVGLIPMLVKTFGISLSTAGLTVTVYAAGIAIGAPLLTLLTGQINRKTLLMATMLLFILGNLISAVAPAFWVLLLGRILAALAHGIFMTISSLIAANVVPKNKRASAIAIMFTGLTIATVTGVPLGTFIGELTSWHFSFLFIVGIGVIGLIADFILVPKNLPTPGRSEIRGIWRILGQPQLLLALLITVFGYGATFPIYTYLSPILMRNMGWQPRSIILILVLYGMMVAIGNSVGGRLANQSPLTSLLRMFTGLGLATLSFFLLMNTHYLGLMAVLFLGLMAFMSVPGLQLFIVQLAEKFTPKDVTMASALNISAFNVGIAMGSTLGGKLTQIGGLSLTPFGSLMLVITGIGLTLWLQKLIRATH
ncbi:MFS transporter [Levilactobacillus bambusae]|uniref:MFS sugar transporter n=1 Tax=Levilactobacillus bambusae TaxID=2024736 RepID=A0A2V1N3I5_9LACO|nr:MFS transporter [Levilactobacillus bambusae]PWG01018.1 MFS sugar transporter [Levilactobacillus bambusae]